MLTFYCIHDINGFTQSVLHFIVPYFLPYVSSLIADCQGNRKIEMFLNIVLDLTDWHVL